MFKRSDWIVGIVSVFLGAFILLLASAFQERTTLDTAGPGGVPSFLAWGILIIGIIHLAGAFFAPKVAVDKHAQWAKNYNEAKPILQITLVCAIYILLIELLGYLITTPLLIFGIMWVVNVRNIKNLLITSLSTTVILFLVFQIGLKVKLPMGVLKTFF